MGSRDETCGIAMTSSWKPARDVAMDVNLSGRMCVITSERGTRCPDSVSLRPSGVFVRIPSGRQPNEWTHLKLADIERTFGRAGRRR